MNWFRAPKTITMLKKAISVITSFAVMATMFVMPFSAAAASDDNWQSYAASSYAGGDGSENNPYLIATAGQLAYLAQKVNSGTDYYNKYFSLTADLDLSGHQWTPIATGEVANNVQTDFEGNFDGGGHVISGLSVGTSSDPAAHKYVGLFGNFISGSLINLTLEDASVYASSNATFTGSLAGLFGSGSNCVIRNCHTSGQVTTTCALVGGMIGNLVGKMDNCTSSVNVSGDAGEIGGIVGKCNFFTMENCSATGSVSGGTKNSDNSESQDAVGGITGYNNGTISNCYFTGAFSFTGDTLNNHLGGIAGENLKQQDSPGIIANCYCAASSVTLSPFYNFGGIVGCQTQGGTESGNYWRSDYSGSTVDNSVAISNGLNPSTSPSDAKMSADGMRQSSFVGTLNANTTNHSEWYKWASDTANSNGGNPVFVPLDSDVTLSNLYVSNLNYSPAFSSDTLNYSLTVPDTVNQVYVLPSVHLTSSSVTVNGRDAARGQVTVNLSYGANAIRIKVTAQNGLTRVYTVTVTRNANANANLSNLSVSGGTLSPGFTQDHYSYDVSLPYNVSSTTITPTLADPGAYAYTGAHVTVGGNDAESGTPSPAISLYQGQTKEVDVVVTAENGVATNTYQINITRAAPENPALSSLSFSTGLLSPAFSSNTGGYVLTVPQSATSVKITPTAANAGETVKINGGNLAGGSATVGLTPGTGQNIGISVKASDGSSSKTYNIHVTWQRPNWQDSGSVAGSFGGGSGSASDPYLISSAGQLAYLAQQVNSGNTYSGTYFNLTGDIDLSGKDWMPIGNMFCGFFGTFDGGGHIITGLTIGTATDPDIYYSGLFYLVGNPRSRTATGAVKNVSVAAREYVGSASGGCLVAANYGTIDNCSVSGSITGTGNIAYLAGICAYNNGTISDSHTSAAVNGNSVDAAGGVAGDNQGRINGCYSTGNISGGNNVGGIAGENYGAVMNSYSRGGLTGGDSADVGGITGDNESSVTNCYSAASLTGGDFSDTGDNTHIGGIVGYNDGSIANCYAVGSLVSTATSDMGGVAGDNDSGATVTNSYWSLGETQKQGGATLAVNQQKGTGGGSDGGTQGLAAADMTNTAAAVTFAQTLNNNRTSDGTLWRYISGHNGGFPVLNGTGEGCGSDAALSSLQVGTGALSPQFASAQTDYTVTVGKDAASLTVTPTASDAWAAVKVNGKAVTGGSPTAVDLTPDSDTGISIVVTAQDGTTVNTYSITVQRAASVSGVVVSPSVSSVIQGHTQAFTSNVTTTGNAAEAVKWSVSGNKSNATTIDGNGHLTVASNETASALTVKAVSVYDASQSATAAVTVLPSKITDSGTDITYDLSGATLPSGVTSISLGITAIPQSNSDDSTFMVVKKLLRSDASHGKLSGFQLVDLKLLDQNGNPIKPTGGAVTVRIPIPSGMSGNLHVYWYNPADGTLTDMNATQENGYLVFTTSHFSDYAIAQFVSSTGGENSGVTSSIGSSTSSGAVPNPKTGSNNWPLIPLAVLGTSSAAGLVVIGKRVRYRVKR